MTGFLYDSIERWLDVIGDLCNYMKENKLFYTVILKMISTNRRKFSY